MPSLWLTVITRSASAGILPFDTFRVLRPLSAARPNLARSAFNASSRNDFPLLVYEPVGAVLL